MTDHADTIRAAELRAKSQLSHFASGSGDVKFCDRCGKPLNQWDGPCEQPPTLAALLANDVLVLVAERQQAQQDISDAAVVYADLMTKWNECVAERQQAIDERDEAERLAESHKVHANYTQGQLDDALARCEQAIDALEQAHADLESILPPRGHEALAQGVYFAHKRIDAALLSLGEQP